MMRILFVDDEARILDGLRRMLRGQRRAWDMVFAAGGQEAVDAIDAAPFDLIITDMRMPGLAGIAVLRHAWRTQPQAVRFVLSGHSDRADTARAVRLAHQFIVKPSTVDGVRSAIERVGAARATTSARVHSAAGRIEAVRVPEQRLADLIEVIADSQASPESVLPVVAGDPWIAAKVLQTVNSAFFGGAREVSGLAEAVTILGVGLLRDLVREGEIFRCEDGLSSQAAVDPEDFRIDDSAATAALLGGITERLGQELSSDRDAISRADGKMVGAETAAGAADAHGFQQRLDADDACTPEAVATYLLTLWNLPPALVARATQSPSSMVSL